MVPGLGLVIVEAAIEEEMEVDEVVEAIAMMVEVVEVEEAVLMAVIKEEMMVVMVRLLHLYPLLMAGQVAITRHLQTIMVGMLVMKRMQFLHLPATLVDLIHIPHHTVLLLVMEVILLTEGVGGDQEDMMVVQEMLEVVIVVQHLRRLRR